MTRNAIFVAVNRHLSSEIPGGVQVCTRDYIKLLQACEFNLAFCPVEFTRNVWSRIKVRLGIDVYNGYDFARIARSVVSSAREHRASYVAINQVSLIPLLPIVRRQLGKRIKTIVLSHGNESGDFLYGLKKERPRSFFRQSRGVTRLGALICQEAWHFTQHADVVLSISKTEREINRWLGAKHSIFVPRIFEPRFLDWKPDLNRVGFLGTLDHPPNRAGLEAVLRELRKLDGGRLRIRVVGGPASDGAQLARQYPAVEYVGHLKDCELEQEATTWAIFLNPVLWYARGASTKLAQGINWGLPVLSTPAGIRGYIWREGSLLVAHSAKELAELIVANTASDARLRELAAGVRAIALSGPTYDEVAKQLELVL